VLVFQLDGEGPADDDEGDEAAPSHREWSLPAADFHGLWESLHYESGVQQRLLRYAASALLFAEHGVSPRLVSWNRVVLLHGPPGTGKTSLCQALAQKLTIRLADRCSGQGSSRLTVLTGCRWATQAAQQGPTQLAEQEHCGLAEPRAIFLPGMFPHLSLWHPPPPRYPGGGVLIEVNAHSLFSKWFSESGKLVARLFAKIQVPARGRVGRLACRRCQRSRGKRMLQAAHRQPLTEVSRRPGQRLHLVPSRRKW
jgi:DNA polymerase III delta prime subunit